MARIRTVKPGFWRDEALSTVSAEAALLAIGLLNVADDEGYFNANPKLIEADIFPLRDLSLSTHILLSELENIGYVSLFKGTDGKNYGHVTNFAAHQVITRKTDSKIKWLRPLSEPSVSPHGVITPGREGNKEGKGKDKPLHQQQLRDAIFSRRDFLIEHSAATEETFEIIAEQCLAHYSGRHILNPAEVALRWFKGEWKQPARAVPQQGMSQGAKGLAVIEEMKRRIDNEMDVSGSDGGNRGTLCLASGQSPGG